jgi:predicted RNA binding protein YcfA (HicA-like mRNA interferase family)
MSRLPLVSGKDLVKALEKAGFILLRQKGSHISMEKKDEHGTWRTVVPMHREVRPGTLHDILKQTGMTREELVGLL